MNVTMAMPNEGSSGQADHSGRLGWGLIALLVAGYALLWNRHWVPGGDSDFYLCIARNLVKGQVYMYNGRPVTGSPPGWPLVLAGLLKICPTFGFLKLTNLACIVGFLAMAYRILIRFTSPLRAAGIVLLAAINSHVYTLTLWLHSDALFCFVSLAGVLLALRMSQKPWGTWRLPVLLLLCIAAVVVRWAGLANALLVACALFNGRPLRPWRPNAGRLAAACCCVLLAMTTYFTIYYSVRAMRDRFERQHPPTIRAQADKAQQPPAVGEPLSLRVLARSAFDVGQWDSALLWEPFRVGSALRAVDVTGCIVGWLVTAACLIGALALIRRNYGWLWLGVAAYSVGLHVVWPRIESRYLVPLLPMILLGVVEGLGALAARWPRTRPWWNGLTRLFLGSILLCNLGLYLMEATVARSTDFYAHYEDGLDRSLVDADDYLAHHSHGQREIAVSLRYANLPYGRPNPFGQRVTVLLTGRDVLSVGPTLGGSPVGKLQSAHLLTWLKSLGAKYYLYQEPVVPWRVGHYRVPIWLEARLTGRDPAAIQESGDWELWDLQTDPIHRIDVPRASDVPNRVPGF